MGSSIASPDIGATGARRGRRIPLASLVLALAAMLALAGPAFGARYVITNHLHVSDCIGSFVAEWSRLPSRVRTYRLWFVSDGTPTEVLASGISHRSGSWSQNLSLEGSGLVSSTLVFYDVKDRAVLSVADAEGSFSIACG